MNIHMITTSYPLYRGHMAGHFLQALADRLVARGHRVKVYAPNDGASPEVADEAGVSVHRFPFFPRGKKRIVYGSGVLSNLVRHPLSALELPGLMAGLTRAGKAAMPDADIVHAHWAVSAHGVPAGAPLVISIRGSDLSGAGGPLVNALSRRQLKKARGVVAENRMLGELAQTICPQVTVLGNGVDLDRFSPGDCTRSERKPVFLFAGRLAPVKGVDRALAAFDAVHDRLGDFELQIVGDGPHRSIVEHYQSTVAWKDRIRWQGEVSVDAMPAAYRSADALLLSSRGEGMPNNAMESLACGLPVIAVPVGGVPDLIRDGAHGLLAASDTPEALGEAMLRFAGMPTEWSRMSLAARAYAETHLHWDRIVDRYEAFYTQVLAES
jgi:glycogen synthase